MRRDLIRSGIVAFVLVYVICLNSACMHHNQFPRQTAAMDSISVVLHKADSNLSAVDSVNIRKRIDHIFIVLGDVKSHMKDSVSHDAADILKSFNSVRWELQTYLGRQAVIKIEMRKSISQLKHLSHDIQNNLIKQDSVMGYYGMEMKKATELIEASQHGLKVLNIQMPLYDLIVPKADSLDAIVKTGKGI
jgi:hypothetical protein